MEIPSNDVEIPSNDVETPSNDVEIPSSNVEIPSNDVENTRASNDAVTQPVHGQNKRDEKIETGAAKRTLAQEAPSGCAEAYSDDVEIGVDPETDGWPNKEGARSPCTGFLAALVDARSKAAASRSRPAPLEMCSVDVETREHPAAAEE